MGKTEVVFIQPCTTASANGWLYCLGCSSADNLPSWSVYLMSNWRERLSKHSRNTVVTHNKIYFMLAFCMILMADCKLCIEWLAGQTHSAAAKAVYWWHSSWNHRRNTAEFLWEMGWNCRLCCDERSIKWKVCCSQVIHQYLLYICHNNWQYSSTQNQLCLRPAVIPNCTVSSVSADEPTNINVTYM